MNLEAALLAEHSRRQRDLIVAWVGGEPRRFAKVVGVMLGDAPVLAQRAAWVVSVVAEAHPAWSRPHLGRLLDHLARPKLHPAVSRAIFRLLQFAPIPGVLEGRVLAVALAGLGGPTAIAVKVCAMTVLKRLAADSPALLTEIRQLIDEQLPTASPAFRARARREFRPTLQSSRPTNRKLPSSQGL